MEKFDHSKNLFEDIIVFEYVAGTLSAEAKTNFEKALSEDEALQQAVASEQAFRASVEQSKPEPVVCAENIDDLFKLIDKDELPKPSTLSESGPSKNVVKFNFTNQIAGSAIAACLLVAVFFSVNFSNDNLLEPKFQALSNSDQPTTVNLDTLSSKSRLVKFTLASPLSSSDVEQLLAQYQLISLNQSPNSTSIVAQATQSLDEQAMSIIQADARIKSIELVKLNESKK